MTVVSVAVLLGLVLVLLIRLKAVRVSAAVICVLFGLVLGVTPLGDPVNDGLSRLGGWAWGQVAKP